MPKAFVSPPSKNLQNSLKKDPLILKKAEQWLAEQDEEWLKHFQDPDLLVRFYLNFQKNQDPSLQKNSLKKDFLEETLPDKPLPNEALLEGAVLKISQSCAKTLKAKTLESVSLLNKNQDPPAFLKALDKEPTPSKNTVLKESSQNQAFYLDEQSLQSLKSVKEEWNLDSISSALRFLIQVGQKNLNRLKN